MKTQEELKALKEEYESLSKKLAELSDEELKLITGGENIYEKHFYDNEVDKDFEEERQKFRENIK